MIWELVIVALTGVGGTAVGSAVSWVVANKRMAIDVEQLREEREHQRHSDEIEKRVIARQAFYSQLRETVARWNRASGQLFGLVSVQSTADPQAFSAIVELIETGWDENLKLSNQIVELRSQIADGKLLGILNSVFDDKARINPLWKEMSTLIGGKPVTDPTQTHEYERLSAIAEEMRSIAAPNELAFNQRIEELLEGYDNTPLSVAKTKVGK